MKRKICFGLLLLAVGAIASGIVFNVWWPTLAGLLIGVVSGGVLVYSSVGHPHPHAGSAAHDSGGYASGRIGFRGPFHGSGGMPSSGGPYHGGGSSGEGGGGSA